METRPDSLAVLISGRGSNLRALIEAQHAGTLGGVIGVVVSNRAGAGGLDHARAAGIDTLVVPHGAFDSRDAFDSGADRHANIGSGEIDPDAILAVVQAAGAPVVVETPGGAEGQGADIAWLRERLR